MVAALNVMERIIRTASASDAPALVRLINKAFAVERFFKEADRTDLDDIRHHMKEGTFLVLEEGTDLAACVFVRVAGKRGYIGLLSVDPTRQGAGLGSFMMQRAEDYCARAGCRVVDLRIVNLRQELLSYYGKRGYVQQGIESAEIVQAKLPIHFVLLAKNLY
jgi:GNAT superfamily N-acetyltransferase